MSWPRIAYTVLGRRGVARARQQDEHTDQLARYRQQRVEAVSESSEDVERPTGTPRMARYRGYGTSLTFEWPFAEHSNFRTHAKGIVHWTATKRRSRVASWSIIAPPFRGPQILGRSGITRQPKLFANMAHSV